ncbi:general substrate transporter [Xylariomycetidae sp. FL0641]|nr:general substrate transporter [Xylariomycetidae sp. FL0641]
MSDESRSLLRPPSDEREEEEEVEDNEEEHLLPTPAPAPAPAPAMPSTTLGKVRAYWLGSVVCMGGFLFGYDSGIVGGVLTLDSFESDFRYGSGSETRTSSLAVSLQQLGAFVACFIAWPMADKLGRKMSLMIASTVFIVGAIIETINTHSLPAFYVARVIAGLGLGVATVVVPMFNSEMMPKDMRGKVGSFFQLFFTLGIFVSYWIDYGVARDIGDSNPAQWQIPIGLQIAPAAFLGFGMLTVTESARWLTKKGRHDEAWASLQWIRADHSQATVDEMEEIRVGVEAEARATEGFQIRELVQRENFKRVFAAFAIFTAQQATGATAFAYFGPQYFKLIVGSGDKDLLLTAIFGAIKVAACGVFVFGFSERLSRRQVLIGGAAFMAACQITTAAVVKALPAPDTDDPQVTSSGIATIALIYLFVIAYNFSWGPMPWPYVSEIFSARIREPGVAIGVAAQWLFNFVFSLTTPYMIDNIGWGTFLLWGIFDVIIAVVSYFFLKETRGLSLEAISHQRFKRGSSRDDLGWKAGEVEHDETVASPKAGPSHR